MPQCSLEPPQSRAVRQLQPPANHRHHQGDQRQHRVLQFEIQAGPVATLRRRREKLHYLNPVPIRQIAIAGSASTRADASASSPTSKDIWKEKRMTNSRFVYVAWIRTTPEKLREALATPEFTRQYWCETWQESDWKPGSSWKLMIPDGRVGDAGEILDEMDKPNSKLIEGVSGGWPNILSSLKSLLETEESREHTRHWPKGMQDRVYKCSSESEANLNSLLNCSEFADRASTSYPRRRSTVRQRSSSTCGDARRIRGLESAPASCRNPTRQSLYGSLLSYTTIRIVFEEQTLSARLTDPAHSAFHPDPYAAFRMHE